MIIIETNLKRHISLRGLFEVICKVWMSPAKLFAMIVSEPNKSIKQGKIKEYKLVSFKSRIMHLFLICLKKVYKNLYD